MALSNTTILYIVELAIYLFLTPIIIYLAWRHGKRGLLGFFYFSLFAALRLVSDIIFISQRNDRTPSEAASIVSSIGLSPLLLALAGFIHEEHMYLVIANNTPSRAKQIEKYASIAQILVHMAAVGGIVMVIIATIGIINAEQPGSNATQSQINSHQDLREAGSVVLLLVWLTLAVYAAWLFRSIVRTNSPVRTVLRVYALCIVAASFFVGVKAVYGVTYSFDHNDTSLSPITGSFAVKLVLVVLVQLGAVFSLTVGAWFTRTIKNEQHYYQPATGGSPGERVELMPPTGYKSEGAGRV